MVPNVIGLLAGLLKRSGDNGRAEELLQKLQLADANGVPRGLAVYHWVLGLARFRSEVDYSEAISSERLRKSPIMLRIR